MNNKMKFPNLGGNLMSSKISTTLIKELRNGRFKDDDKLPAENDLAVIYNVSRTVIRDVLSDLERDGFIARVRGIGTAINRDILNISHRLDLKFEYNELISEVGANPVPDNISVHTAEASPDIAKSLNIDDGERVLVLERRMLADNVPVIYSTDYIPLYIFAGVDYHNFDWVIPIFDLLEKHCGISVVTDIAEIKAVMGDDIIRKKLNVNDNKPLIMLDEIGYSKLGHPIMRSFEYYTDFFNFTVLRRKL